MKKMSAVSKFAGALAALALCGGLGVGTVAVVGNAAHADEGVHWAIPSDFPVVTGDDEDPQPIENDEPAMPDTIEPTDYSVLPLVPGEGDTVNPANSMVSDTITPWESAEKVDEHTITVNFMNGTPACYTAYATVSEDTNRIVITVHTGIKTSAPDVCTMEMREDSVIVHTQQEIGNTRVIVDGATNEVK